MEELRTLTASHEEKRRMEDILLRLHQQQIEDLEEGDSNSDNDDEGDHESDEELVDGFSLKRAMLLAQAS